MSSSGSLDVGSLFSELLVLTRAEREARLHALRAVDAAHHRALVALFDAHDDLAQSAAEQPSAALDLPGFRVLGPAGEGGGGSVFKAERIDTGGLVAIKLLHPDTPAYLLEIEKRSLSRLSHPSIVRFYGSGVARDGRPFAVLEYVAGLPLSKFVSGREIRERLALFDALCEAVGAAHAEGLIHRDLKPDNVLVTAEGRVRLVDFGIAQQLSEQTVHPNTPIVTSHLTVRLLGTPQYAAPEQYRGEHAATASDVYALGVILYELLTGMRPHALANLSDRRAAVQELAHRVCTQDPAAPSTHAPRSFRKNVDYRDFDRIALKALARSPGDRYRTVDALRADVRSALRIEPLRDVPPLPAEALRKLLRRNAKSLTVAGLLAGLVIALTVGYVLNLRAALLRAAAEASRATRAELVMDNLLAGGDPSAGPGVDLRVETLLQRAVEHAQQLHDQATAATILTRVGVTYTKLGRYTLAKPLLEQAHALDLRTGRDDDPALARDHLALGELALMSGELEPALAHAQEAMQRAARDVVYDHTLHAAAVTLLAAVLNADGQADQAEQLLSDAITRLQLAGASMDAIVELQNERANAMFYQGKLSEAEPLYRAVLAYEKQTLGAQHPDLAKTLLSLSAIALQRGNRAEAAQLSDQALRISYAHRGLAHADSLAALVTLANVYILQAQFAEADDLLTRAREQDRLLRDRDDPARIPLLRQSLVVATMLGRALEAEQLSLELLQLSEPLAAARERRGARIDVATTLLELGSGISLARQLLREALQDSSASQADRAVTQLKLGRALRMAGHHFAALSETSAALHQLSQTQLAAHFWVSGQVDTLSSCQALGLTACADHAAAAYLAGPWSFTTW